MSIVFRPLWTIEVRHAFHGGACEELAFVVPPRTLSALAGARAIARERDGRLHVLLEVDSVGDPIAAQPGMRFVFGLVPRSTRFHNYTQPEDLQPGQAALFSNSAGTDALQIRGVRIVGERPTITPGSSQRPSVIRVIDDSERVRWTHTLGTAEETVTLPGIWPVGPLQLEESGSGPSLVQSLFVEPDLAAAGVWGVLDLTVHPDHIANGAEFAVELQARSDQLRYYVVASRYSQSEFDGLTVKDTGFASDARSEVPFVRVLPAAFDAQHLPASLLDAHGTSRIVLFEAQAQVVRRERGARGIALRRNGEVLIDSLPQPGADRSDAQFVVHLSKP